MMDVISGKALRCDNGSLVWLGKDLEDSWLVVFRNRDGEVTRLRLSDNAMSALSELWEGRDTEQWGLQWCTKLSEGLDAAV